jgi:hypothetical protein
MATNLYTSATGLSTVFSGADTVVIFGDEYVGECMSFTLGINREAGPLYVMGKKSPIAIPKGKRGIGGSFILAQLGYDALLEYTSSIQTDKNKQSIWVRKDEIVQQVTGSTRDEYMNPNTTGAGALGTTAAAALLAKQDLWASTTPFYADQIPPFNVTVVGTNEQGDKMAFRVFGLQILNDGIGISIDELNIEKRYTYVATAASRMMKLEA